MRRPTWLLVLFLFVSLLAGFVFWRQTDWCAYVDMRSAGRGMVPKFEWPPMEQFIASSVIGMAVGGSVTGAACVASKIWGRRRRSP